MKFKCLSTAGPQHPSALEATSKAKPQTACFSPYPQQATTSLSSPRHLLLQKMAPSALALSALQAAPPYST